MGFGDRELQAALGGPLSVLLVAGAVAFRGFRDEESADVLTAGGEYTAQVVRRSLLVRTAEIPSGVVVEAVLTIDEEAAIVRQLVPVDDGALTRIIYVPA